MRNLIRTFLFTLVALVALDASVAAVLMWSERTQRLESLVTYFDYGRSVPGKIERWQDGTVTRGNLLKVAWLDREVAKSQEAFQTDPATQTPTVRTYGMSFVDNISQAAKDARPDLVVDRHSGPGAPPNFTFAFFQQDKENRNPGDIAVLGILSSSVHAMAALSNRSWAYEQPAPFTYPIFTPGPNEQGLTATEPVIATYADQVALQSDPALAAAWYAQLQSQDRHFSQATYGFAWSDHSPFLRLVRRSLAKSVLARSKRDILQNGTFPYEEVLQRMVRIFAAEAQAEGLHPIVILVQTRRPGDPDLAALLGPDLRAEGIAYLATADFADSKDPSLFRPDGHYTPKVDALFGTQLLRLIDSQAR